jgi:iron complex outermembrane receptor protein
MERKLHWGAVSLLLAAPLASAQNAAQGAATTPGSADSALEEVVVSGVRRSLENAIETKRVADTVVDVISAEDVGKFPTENVAESLQRVTGVQITRFRGEGQNVTIRGLPTDFTLVQLNGRSLTSALGASGSGVSRSFDFTILPSEFVGRVEVFKAPTADLEEGGLAGTVIAHTVRPLDIGKRKLAGTVEEANESNRDKWSPRASAFYTDVFSEDRIGISLGAAYTKRLTETHEQRITRFRRAPESAQGGLDLDGNGVVEDGKGGRPLDNTRYALLDSVFHTLYPENRERKTGTATVQFRPNEHWDFVADGFYGKVNLFSPRYTDLLRIGIGLKPGGPVVPGSVVLGQRPGNSSAVGDNGQPANTLEAAEFRGVDQRADGRTEQREGDLTSLSLGGTFQADNGFSISTEVGHSRATQVMYNPLLENTRFADLAYDVRQSSDLVSYHFGGNDEAQRLNPATFTLLGLNGEWGTRRKDEQTDASVDAQMNVPWGWLNSLKAGVRGADRKVYADNRRIVATAPQLAPLWNGGAPQLFLKEVHPSTGDFLGAAGDTRGLVHQSWLVNDPFAFIGAFGKDRIESVSTITNDPTGINDVKERTGALYLRGNIASPQSRLTGNIGVRVVRTEQTSVGVAPDLTAITFQPQGGSITTVPAAGPLRIERDYTDVLPSLNLKLEVSEDFLVRFAASRTMSRPTLTQISPSVSANGPGQTITANNPYLDPFRSKNADLSAEWYFAQGGLLAGTLFYKDIVSVIQRVQTQIPLTITQINGDGTRQPLNQIWTLSSLVNGAGTSVSGAELAYQQNFTFLPSPFDGFGVLANYTYMDTHGGNRLQGASKNNYTASIYYEKGRFGGRLNYTYRGEFYVDTEGNSQDDRIQQPFGTLDANLTYSIGDYVSLVLEATNILQDSDQVLFEPIDLPAFYTDNGRRILFGLRATF